MPSRAYLRLDPHWYDRKVLGIDADGDPIKGWKAYSADALVAFCGVLALADMQPERGTFRSERIVRELLRGANGYGARYARQVSTLIGRGDLVRLSSGRIYVDGWREWQEGDLTVAERMRRMRARKAGINGTAPVTAAVTPGVTAHVTEAVTAPPSDGGRLAEAEAEALAEAEAARPSRARRSMTDDERDKVIGANRALLSETSTSEPVRRAAIRTLSRLDPETDWASITPEPPTARPRTARSAAHG
jgi:hypothetical protein